MAHPKHDLPDPNPRPGNPAHPAPQTGEELDIYPAGAAYAHHHHGHTIVSPFILIAVLGALLFLTLLTVGAAQFETLLIDNFNIVIPHWVNVVIALSIATVKTTLVVMFFMQLKYDNPLNTIIFIFTMITVLFFLGFTLTDMGGRGSINRYKEQYIVDGGIGGVTTPRGTVPANTPITKFARETAKAAAYGDPHKPPAEAKHGYERRVVAPDPRAIARREGFPILGSRVWEGSSREQSRPVKGVTLPGFAPTATTPPHPDHPDALERREQPGSPDHGTPPQDVPRGGGGH